MSCTHVWKNRGICRPHAQIGRIRPVWYVRCALCQDNGFLRGGSAVIYTWNPADAVGGPDDE